MPDGVKRPIRVLIAGLASSCTGPLSDIVLTSPDIGQVDLVSTLKEAVELLERKAPDVFVVEIPLEDGIYPSVLRRAAKRNPGLSIVAVASRGDAQVLLQAAFLGASAFVRRDTLPRTLVSIIRRVYQGEESIGFNVSAEHRLVADVNLFARGPVESIVEKSEILSPLSQQQHKVLTAAAQGLTNNEIGKLLGLREQTVKNYMTVILKRTGTQGRVQAVVRALKDGWIDLGEHVG